MFIESEFYDFESGDIFYINPFRIHGVQVEEQIEQSSLSLTMIIPLAFIDKYCPIYKKYKIKQRKLTSESQDIAVYQRLIKDFNELLNLGYNLIDKN